MRSPRGQIKSEGENENEKDSGKKGIEAEHREAIEGRRGPYFDDRAPKETVIGLATILPSLSTGLRVADNHKGLPHSVPQPFSVFLGYCVLDSWRNF